MTDTKRKLLGLNREHCLNELLDDLMVLINITQNTLFSRVDKNRTVIADRGFRPYNYNILTFSQIRATMTDSDYLKDIKYHVVLSLSSPVSNITNNLFINKLFPSINGCSD